MFVKVFILKINQLFLHYSLRYISVLCYISNYILHYILYYVTNYIVLYFIFDVSLEGHVSEE